MTEKQTLAWNLYMNTGLTQQKIAEFAGVNRKTLYDWIKQGRWDKGRTTAFQAPGVITEQFCGQLIALNENIAAREEPFPTRDDSTIISRIHAALKTFLPDKKSLTNTIRQFTDFVGLAKEKCPQIGDQIAALIKEYLTDLLQSQSPDPFVAPAPVPYRPAPAAPSPAPPAAKETDSTPASPAKNGVQNGVSPLPDKQSNKLNSNILTTLPNTPSPKKENEKWGVPPTLAGSPQALTSTTAPTLPLLPEPRNRSERREQERRIKKLQEKARKLAQQ